VTFFYPIKTRCSIGCGRSIALLTILIYPLFGAAQSTDSEETFGGPSGVPGELREAREIQEERYRRDERDRALAPWYAWKGGVSEGAGLTLGVNGSLLYQNASEVIGTEDDATGQIYRIQGDWQAFTRLNTTGSLLFRIESRSKIGGGIPPSTLKGEIGAVATDPGFPYSDNFGTDFSVLAWQQLFNDGRAGVAAGLLDFSAYLDASYFQTISRGFLNRTFILSPTTATTGIGALGAVAKGMLNDQWWVGGGFYDGNAKSGDPSFDTWDSSELFKHIEVGWTPAFGRRTTDRIQLTYWSKDRQQATGTPSGSGWLLTANWELADRYVSFLSAGHSNGGGGAAAEESLAFGVARRMAFQDWLTIGAGWNKPSERTHGDQLRSEAVIEVSYVWQLTANTSLMPDIQLIFDPANSPTEDKVWVAGIRLRVAL
jgi:carbohydrate-selective porin OprB